MKVVELSVYCHYCGCRSDREDNDFQSIFSSLLVSLDNLCDDRVAIKFGNTIIISCGLKEQTFGSAALALLFNSYPNSL